jgi:hypothetical protein
MMLAEISVTDQWIIGTSIVMCASTLGALVVMIIALEKKQAVRVDQPLEVQFAAEFVHRNEFEDQANTINQLANRVTTVEKELTKKISEVGAELHATEMRLTAGGEQRVSALHTRINQLLEAVGEIKGELKNK